MQDDGYKVGKSGGSVFSTNDALGWAAGDFARKNEAEHGNALHGESHPHTIQGLILLALTGIPIAIFTHTGIIPWGPYASVGLAIVAFFSAYFFLRWLPNWLSGGIMATLLGGGAIVYFLFSRLD